MIDAVITAFEWSWTPGFRGILTVALATVILCGSVYLIVATNTGSRLGFLIALTGFCGWMTVMGIIWSMYGIGYKGKSPSWHVVDVVRSEPDSGIVDSRIDVAQSLPLPAELDEQFGTPVEIRDGSPALTAAFPPDQRDPSLGDLVAIDPALQEKINDGIEPWRILESSNKYTGETQAVVAEALGPNGQGIFASASDYVVVDSYLTGGRTPRTDDSILARATYKVTSTLEVKPDDFYAVVQLQPVIPQETKPGQAPPTPIRDESQPIYSVVLKRQDGHLLRRPQMTMTLAMGLVTGMLCWSLHRRDKLAEAQRAATAGAA